MWNKIKKTLCSHKGFTLMEMISVITIIVVIGTITTVAVYGYMVTAYMLKANDTAKTIFLASQSYLTQQKEIGALGEFNKNVSACRDTTLINGSYGGVTAEYMFDVLGENKYIDRDGEDGAEWKKNHESSRIVAIQIDSSEDGNRNGISDKENVGEYNPFWAEIVEQNIKDESITDHTFLMEYDQTTGVVLGVFYTEKVDTFFNSTNNPYDTENLLTEKDNVVMRDVTSLREKRQGYYGVNMSNYASNTVTLEKPVNVKLVNSDRLYLEWTEPENPIAPENGVPAGADAKVIYKIEIYSKINGKLGEVSTPADKSTLFKDWERAEGLQTDGGGSIDLSASSPVFIYNEGAKTFGLLLDCIHYGIKEAYPDFKDIQAQDMLYCKVTTRISGSAGSADASNTSNTESALYGGGDKTAVIGDAEVPVGGSGELEDGAEKPFTVKYARHLNNMRYAMAESCFTQTGSIDWKYPEKNNDASETPIKYDEFFEPLVYNDDTNNEIPYAGTFKGKENKDYKISNLKIKVDNAAKGKYVGMFARSKGTIQGLSLYNASVSGYECVGIIAGENTGKISGLNIYDSSVTGYENVGAVTGTNMETGILFDILTVAQVTGKADQETELQVKAGNNIGGIVGKNLGTAKKLTAYIKEGSDSVSGQQTVKGLSNVGGVIGYNASADVKDLVNYNNIGIPSGAKGELQNFGGIVGVNKEDAKIEGAVNKGKISLPVNVASDVKTVSYIGGIAGKNMGTLKKCENNLDHQVFGDRNTLLQECLNSLNQENGKLPEYMGVCVGGIAGLNTGNKAVIDQCSVNSTVYGERLVGGLVGVNMAEVKRSGISAGEDTQGLVIGSGSMVGGIFGYTDKNDGLSGYTNGADVFGKSIVGGITGINGVKFTSLDKLLNFEWDTELDNLGKDNNKNYELLRTKGLSNEARMEIQVSFENYYAKLMEGVLENSNVVPGTSMSDCKNTGFVYARSRYSGGIAGINFGKIQSCVSSYEETAGDIINSGYENLATADCVGGIVGLNMNQVIGSSNSNIVNNNIVYGNSFVGGIVGWNTAMVKGYTSISGSVRGKENYVGGFIGMNSDLESIDSTEITYNGGTNSAISGKNYVGGIIGCNVAALNKNGEIKINANTGTGINIQGEAYVGGILGYCSSVKQIENIPQQCAGLTVKNPYQSYNPNGMSDAATENTSKISFVYCTNNANVQGARYVGGIIGYNHEDTTLRVSSCSNFGNIIQNLKNGQIDVEPDVTAADGVEGTSYFIGGITGRNTAYGIIDTCYNDGTVKSTSKYLGGLCEVNEGIIRNCRLGDRKNFQVEGEYSVGGITGLNRTAIAGKTAIVEKCSANQYASVIGGNNTGGLVGTNFAEVSNCITNANVSAKNGNRVGGIIGYNAGTVKSTHIGGNTVRPTVEGKNYVGGLLGVNEGTILTEESSGNTSGGVQQVLSGLVNYANVYGENYVGGIVGNHNSSRIEDCENYGNVSAVIKDSNNQVIDSGLAGGITGTNEAGKVINECRNYGDVVSDYSKAGGIVGSNSGTISNCSNLSGTVRSNYGEAGGITGVNSSKILSCTNEGSVKGALAGKEKINNTSNQDMDAIGGIAGKNASNAEIQNCSSRRNEAGTNLIVGSSNVGGIVGWNQGKVTVSNTNTNYYDMIRDVNIGIRVEQNAENSEVNYIGYIGGIIGRMDGNSLKNLENFIYSGSIEIQPVVAQFQCIGGITGNVANGYTVKNCEFRGTISGNGNGYCNEKGELQNGKGGVGGIAGTVSGTLYLNPISGKQNAYGASSKNDNSASYVNGAANVGGLTGSVENSAKILCNNSSQSQGAADHYLNESSVAGTENVGGFFGKCKLSLNSYYNGGVIKGKKSVGGVVGNQSFSGNFITNCVNLETGRIVPNQSGGSQFGGIVGSLTDNVNNITTEPELSNCQNLGEISGDEHQTGITRIGGIVGYVNTNANAVKKINSSTDPKYLDSKGIKISNCVNGDPQYPGLSRGAITCRANNVGGIVGEIVGMQVLYADAEKNPVNLDKLKVHMENNRNYGRITITDGTVRGVGGILGSSSGSGSDGSRYITMKGCKNSGNITLSPKEKFSRYDNSSYGIGGVVGTVETLMRIEECSNSGKVSALNYAQVGGIIGSLKVCARTYSNGKISNCQNTKRAEIVGTGDVGGIIGRQQGTLDGFFVTECENNGSIFGDQFVGGILGNLYDGTTANPGAGFYMDCTNNGNITVTDTATVDDISKINRGLAGGCVGEASASSKGSVFKNMKNFGSIIVQSQARNPSVINLGGVVGITYNSYFEDSENYADLQLMDVSLNITSFGGIAGYVNASGDYGLYRCVNRGSVRAVKMTDGASNTIMNVGGVAGSVSNGMLSGCRNEAGAGKVIEAEKKVGGIVGKADGISTKIMSQMGSKDTGKAFAGSYNTATVIAEQEAGGIVGELNGAAVISVYNTGEVMLNRKSDFKPASTAEKTSSAGGIIGLSLYNSQILNQGLVVNCYNTGKVGWYGGITADPDKASYYIGGIIGYRDFKVATSSNWANHTSGGATVRDCYFIADRVEKSRPEPSNSPIKIPYNAWMIGNEPFDSFTVPNGDSQSDTGYETGKKGYWSEEAYQILCDVVKQKPSWEPKEKYELDNIRLILENYFYKLPVPETQEVQGIEGTSYMMKWKGQLGLTSGYHVSIYTACDESGKHGTGSPVWKNDFRNVNEVAEGVPLNLGGLLDKYVGVPLYVSIKAYGFSVGTDENKLDITLDSDEEIVQSFVMMPPLPKVPLEETKGAVLSVVQEPNTHKVTLKISNANQYFKETSPIKDYPALENLSRGNLLTDGLYDSYRNGIKEKSGESAKKVITVTDYDLATNTQIDPWKYTPRELTYDEEKNEASLTIDYDEEASFLNNRMWHAYVLQTKITPEQEQSSLDPRAGKVKFRYLSSEKVEKRFVISTKKRLTAPTNLNYTFTGTSTASQMGNQVRLEWQNNVENKETVSGYKLTIKNPVTDQTVLEVDNLPPGTRMYLLTAEQIKECMKGTDYPAYGGADTLKWSVTTKSSGIEDANKITYLDSVAAEGNDIRLPVETKSVQNISGLVNSPVFNPNLVDFEWEDEGYVEGRTEYQVQIEAISEGIDVTNEVNIMNTSGKKCSLQLQPTLLKDYELTFKVVKRGELGVTLDSAVAQGKLIVKKSLPQVTDLKASQPVIDSKDSSMVKVDLQWSIPPEINEENCSGYLIAILDSGETEMDKAQIQRLDDWKANSMELVFDTSNLGKDFFAYVYAIGRTEAASSSRPTKSQTIILPSDRLTSPSGIQIKVRSGDTYLDAANPVCTRDELSGLQYEFSWTNAASDLGKLKGCKFTLKDKDGNIVAMEEAAAQPTGTEVTGKDARHSIQIDLSAYAGQEMNMSMVNMSNSMLALSSQSVTVQFKVPAVELKQPQEESTQFLKADDTPVGEFCEAGDLKTLKATVKWKNDLIDVAKIAGHRLTLTDSDGAPVLFNEGTNVLAFNETAEEWMLQMDFSPYQGKTLILEVVNLPVDSSEKESEPLRITLQVPKISMAKMTVLTKLAQLQAKRWW